MRNTLTTTLILLLFCSTLFAQTGGPLTVTITTTAACDHDGTAIATVSGGTAPYSYEWYVGGTSILNNSSDTTDTLTNLAGGWLYVMVDDSAGNSGFQQSAVTPPFTLQANSTPDSCNLGVGTAVVAVFGGTPPYTYAWSNGDTTPTATGLTVGSWDCTVIDSAGCKYSLSDQDSVGAHVWNIASFTVTTSVVPSSCNDGSATMTPAGGAAPYTYYWNTTPVQTTQTATNLPSGSFVCTVTDSNGCYLDVWVWVSPGANAFNVLGTVVKETCTMANGSISLAVSGGTAAYSYAWSNGATTQNITGLSRGYYTVIVTDAAGCVVTKSFNLQRTSPISLSLSKTNSGCLMSTGTATSNPSGGTGPYTYSWNNGGTTPTITGLGKGYYHVTVTDVNGCTKSGWVYVYESTSCLVTIKGKVVIDYNGDCALQPVDLGRPGTFVYASPYGWATTNSLGIYSFKAVAGTYTLNHNPGNYYNLICPGAPGTIAVNAATPSTTYNNNDFWDQPIALVNDLRLSCYSFAARPGFKQKVRIWYYNDGTTTLNGIITVVHDTNVTFFSASPAATSYTLATQTMTFNLGPIKPGEKGYVQVWFSVPTNAVVGTYLTHQTHIDPVAGDTTPANNSCTINRLISNAYDPNAKAATPSGITAMNDSTIHFEIHFQNTGNDTAFNIVLIDTLDANLDIPTFLPGASSHNFDWEIRGSGILEFRFDNIMLPDSNISEEESHGFVAYTIERKNGLVTGTEINNTANIYFDYNPPIVTNTTSTIYCEPVAAAFSIDNATEPTLVFTDNSNGVPSSWAWDFGDGNSSTSQNPSHSYTSTGNYTVTLIINNVCGTDTVTQNIFVLVGLDDPNGLAFQLYPNPSTGIFTIELEGNPKKLRMEIRDLMGRLISGEEIQVNGKWKQNFNMGHLAKGTYFVRMFNGDVDETRKLLIE